MVLHRVRVSPQDTYSLNSMTDHNWLLAKNYERSGISRCPQVIMPTSGIPLQNRQRISLPLLFARSKSLVAQSTNQFSDSTRTARITGKTFREQSMIAQLWIGHNNNTIDETSVHSSISPQPNCNPFWEKKIINQNHLHSAPEVIRTTDTRHTRRRRWKKETRRHAVHRRAARCVYTRKPQLRKTEAR